MTERVVRFETGFISRTPGAVLALIQAGISEASLIERHQSGDFGQLSDADKASNGKRSINDALVMMRRI